MLVLTVRRNEYVQVGDNIRIYNPNDGPVRIGFDAPKEIHITRQSAKNKQPKTEKD